MNITLNPDIIIEDYIKWIRNNSNAENINGVVEITIPFLDANNDHLQYYIFKENTGYIISDYGVTLNELELAGCNINTPARKKQLHQFLNAFGVSLKDEELYIKASSQQDLPYKQHSLMQAMLAVSDMFMLSSSKVKNIFENDIANFFFDNDISYVDGMNKMGSSGFYYKIDFTLPKNRKREQRYVVSLNNPSDSNIKAKLLMLSDGILDTNNEKLFIILNDHDNKSNIIKYLSPIQNVGAIPIPWSERQQHINEFAS